MGDSFGTAAERGLAYSNFTGFLFKSISLGDIYYPHLRRTSTTGICSACNAILAANTDRDSHDSTSVHQHTVINDTHTGRQSAFRDTHGFTTGH